MAAFFVLLELLGKVPKVERRVYEIFITSAVCSTLEGYTHRKMQIGGAYAGGNNTKNDCPSNQDIQIDRKCSPEGSLCIWSIRNIKSLPTGNIYHTKGSILTELTEFMFGNQFNISGKIVGESTNPVLLYAVETCLQLTLAELNENLREIYVEAYTVSENIELIHKKQQYNCKRFLLRIYQVIVPVIFMKWRLVPLRL